MDAYLPGQHFEPVEIDNLDERSPDDVDQPLLLELAQHPAYGLCAHAKQIGDIRARHRQGEQALISADPRVALR